MADPTEREMDLAASAHAVLLGWNSSFAELGEAVRELGQSLSDWLQAKELRMCDGCGKITNAGDSPDWVNGECEDCDPSIQDDDTEADSTIQPGDMKALRDVMWNGGQ